MKAFIYKKYGSPDVLKLLDIPKPIPKENELLVKVFAATVNRTDCANLRAKPFIMRFMNGLLKPNKPIPGTDFAGKIEAVGKNVNSFMVDDKIFGFDDSGLSSYAEYLTISEDKGIATIPEGISYKEAAASIEGLHYAYNFINKVSFKNGQKFLVNGATGAIGSAMVQLLKYYGAYVVSVCNTKNINLIKELGADRTIDYLEEDFTNDKEKYDFVFDAVGKSTFGECVKLLNPEGVYISSELGPKAQNIFFSLSTLIFGKQIGVDGNKKVLFPYPANIKESVLLVKKIIEENKFQSVIDKTYPFEKIPEAFRYVETGEKTGNVVITIHDN